MRLLHTADWHLGRIFYGHHVTEDQAYVLEGQLFDLIRDQAIDGLIIAGDVFDRSVPPVEALALWDRIITRLAAMDVAVFVIAGNHDGAERLAAGRSFYESEGVHIWGTPSQCLAPYIWTRGSESLAICPMPFAEPSTIYDALNLSQEGAKHDYNEMYHQWAQHLASQVPRGMPSLAISHIFAAGAASAGSERNLSVGGTDYVQPKAFAPFSYTALGHIHNSQKAGQDCIRYAGSPLKYSFDEAKQQKSFTILDINQEGQVDLSFVPVQAKRDVVVLRGFLEDLMNDKEKQVQHAEDYVFVELTDQAPVIDGMATLRKAYPHVLALELVGRKAQVLDPVALGQYRQLDPKVLFTEFAKAVWEEGLSLEEVAYMDTVWASVDKEEP